MQGLAHLLVFWVFFPLLDATHVEAFEWQVTALPHPPRKIDHLRSVSFRLLCSLEQHLLVDHASRYSFHV
jgi:hypothetical protein